MPSYEELAATLAVALVAGTLVYGIAQKIDLSRLHWSRNSPRVNCIIDVSVYAFLIGFLVLYAVLDVRKYEAFNVYGLDFSLFDQVIWNSSRGRLFQDTLVADAPLILGQHFSILLLALAPLYSLYSDPRILVVVPVACIVLTALLLYWYARQQVGRATAALVVGSFLLMPGVQTIALGQFYEIMLAMPLLMLATIFLLRKRHVAFFISLGVVLLSKEDIPLIAAGYGVFLLLVQRRFALGAVLTLLSLAWFSVLVQIIMPFIQGSSHYYYFDNAGYGTGQYVYLGGNLAEIVQTLLMRPDVGWQHLMVPLKIDAILKTFVPLGLIPFVGAEVAALALPTLGYTLLSDRESQFILGSHHYSAVFSFLLLGTVIGMRRMLEWVSHRHASSRVQFAFRAAMGTFLLVTSVSNYYLYSLGSLSRNFYTSRYMPTDYDALAGTLASLIPGDAAVLAQMELHPRISQRQYIYVMPGIPCLTTAEYLFADRRRPWYGYLQDAWDHALTLPFFETVAEEDGYILKRRRSIAELGSPLPAQFGESVKLLSYALPITQTVQGGQWLHLLLAWEESQSARKGYSV